MMKFFVLVLSCVFTSVVTMPCVITKDVSEENEVDTYNFPFVTREQWKARTPMQTTPLVTPVPFVVIHHSYIPAACYEREKCCAAMRSMQNFHMDDHEWWDIGYKAQKWVYQDYNWSFKETSTGRLNASHGTGFAVGSDGAAYEGRGFETLGAHSLHFNSVSIGICLIGDWRFELPPAEQRKTAMALIKAGVELGYIRPDYKLVGHRQVRATECPGDALFNEIKTWDHYSSYPNSHKDLLDLEEVPDFVKDIIRGNGTIPVSG